MQAWELERKITDEAIPKILQEEEQTWKSALERGKLEDDYLKMMWSSRVPGSGAPESIMTAKVQALENKGMKVPNAMMYIEKGLKEAKVNDLYNLHKTSALLMHSINNAEKDPQSLYWNYKLYSSWDEYEKAVSFPEKQLYDVKSIKFKENITAGWWGQLIGGAFGTALEGYTTDNLRKVFGELRNYVRKPNTFNDDITYELAFLKAFEEHGYDITSKDIALEWVALIPSGWSAEEIALENIRKGIFPPESGTYQNPFSEWIGAQMRGAICGMAAPANPKEAARLAWIDGVISHANNGVIGEIFNAVLVSLAFVEKEVRKLVEKTIDAIPKDCEYYYVITYAYNKCKQSLNWEQAWKSCEEEFKKYNWVHAYPNAAAEVIALWFGNGDFDETLFIIGMEGQDVDCNAAQIMNAVAIINGMEEIPFKWIEPIGENLETYVRGMEKMKIQELIDWTSRSVIKKSKRLKK